MMKTVIRRSTRTLDLIYKDPSMEDPDEYPILASLSQNEGTPCWRLSDVRLCKYSEPNSFDADKCRLNVIEFKNDDERLFIISKLNDYIEKDNKIIWCDFDGMVKGHDTINGYKPRTYFDYSPYGYFTYQEGLAKLSELKKYWEQIQSLDDNWRIENSNAQMMESELHMLLTMKRTGTLKFLL